MLQKRYLEDSFNNEINGIRNALKHADDPAEDIIEVSEKDSLALLIRAILNYSRLFNGKSTPNIDRLVDYITTQYPDVLNDINPTLSSNQTMK